jgi:undecaprenyl-diphosphatase
MTAPERTPLEPLSPPAALEPDSRRSVAFIVGIAAFIAFVVVRIVVAFGRHQPLPLDVWWNDRMVDIASDPIIVVAWVPAIVGGTIGMFVIGLLLVIVLFVRGRRWDAATLAIAVVTVVAIGAPMAAVIARVRPADSLAESVATSFPSGHTAVATTVVITLALLLRRRSLWIGGVLWVLLMMWSRTYLHAHWLSDVVAGLLEGIVVSTLVWCAMEAWRDRRALRSPHPSTDTSPEGPSS